MEGTKRIAINSVIIFARLIITSLIGIYISRVVLDALGASDFGLYNVVGGIVGLLNLLNTSMISTTYHYIASELGKKEQGNLNRVFNTSRLIHLCFACVIIFMGLTIGEYYVFNYLNVAEGKFNDALFIYNVSIATAAISTMLVPFQGLLVAHERFYVSAIFDVLSSLFKLAMVTSLLYSVASPVRVYSLIMMSWMCLYSAAFYLYSHKHFYSTIKFHLYRDWALCKKMLSFAIWSLVGGFGTIGVTQGSAMVLNYFFSTAINAAYAVGYQVSGMVTMFSNSLSQAAIPQITKSYSGKEEGRSLLLTCYISKYTFLMMALVAFPVLLEMDFLLGLWLKEVPEGATIFCKLIVLENLIWCLGAGVPALVNATGNIKYYQICVYSFLFLTIPMSILIYVYGGAFYSISIVSATICLLSSFLKIYLLKRLYGFDVSLLFKISYVKMFQVMVPLVLGYVLYNPAKFSGMQHLFGIIGAEIYVFTIVLMLGVTKDERVKVFRMIKNKIFKKTDSNMSV